MSLKRKKNLQLTIFRKKRTSRYYVNITVYTCQWTNNLLINKTYLRMKIITASTNTCLHLKSRCWLLFSGMTFYPSRKKSTEKSRVIKWNHQILVTGQPCSHPPTKYHLTPPPLLFSPPRESSNWNWNDLFLFRDLSISDIQCIVIL